MTGCSAAVSNDKCERNDIPSPGQCEALRGHPNPPQAVCVQSARSLQLAELFSRPVQAVHYSNAQLHRPLSLLARNQNPYV